METIKTPKVRRLTVCNKGIQRSGGGSATFFPVIVLTGKWLQDTGFEAGHVIDITCEAARLVITLSAEQRFDMFKNEQAPGT